MKAIVGIALLFLVTLPAVAQQHAENECGQTAGTRIYSNATYVEEAGDVIGIELALLVRQDTAVSALLYDYERTPTTDGVPYSGVLKAKIFPSTEYGWSALKTPRGKKLFRGRR